MPIVTAILVAAAVFIAARIVFRMFASAIAALCAVGVALYFFPGLQAPALAWLLHGFALGAGECASYFSICG
jgi:hypothetical protein